MQLLIRLQSILFKNSSSKIPSNSLKNEMTTGLNKKETWWSLRLNASHKVVKSRYQFHCFPDKAIISLKSTYKVFIQVESCHTRADEHLSETFIKQNWYQCTHSQVNTPPIKKKKNQTCWSRPRLSSLLEDVATAHTTASSSCSHWRKKTPGMTWIWHHCLNNQKPKHK